MKTTFFTLLLLSCCQWLAAQCPTGDITFSTQGQIDSFQINYPGCTEILGVVFIGESPSGTIINLDSLSPINSIGGGLYIFTSTALTSLNGLDNLTSIGGFLVVETNDSLTSLSGLDNLASVSDNLSIGHNDALTSLNGLGNLTSVGGELDIVGNDALTSLSGLNSLTSVGGEMYVVSNDILTSLSGLNSLTSVGGGLYINDNDSLTGLSGLENLTSVGGILSVGNNAALMSLNGLDNLTSIGGFLEVALNTALTSLNGLDNLTSINGALAVVDNAALTSLSGLDNIVPGTITELIIGNNPQLFLCNVQSVCIFLENGGPATVFGNAPGCDSVPEVEEACMESGVIDLSKAGNLLETFPNPATDFLNIQFPEYITAPLEVQLFDAQGRLLRRQPLATGEALDLQGFAAGMYSLKVVVGERVFAGKFVKQ